MSDQYLPDDLRKIESTLRSLSPQPLRIDEARLMFLAGQESVRVVSRRDWRASRWWPLSTALCGALALSLAVFLVVRPRPEPVVVYRDVPGPPAQELAEAERPTLPPAANPEKSRIEPHVGDPDGLASRLPIGELRKRQFAMLQNSESTCLATAAGSGVRPLSQQELLTQYLRENGF